MCVLPQLSVCAAAVDHVCKMLLTAYTIIPVFGICHGAQKYSRSNSIGNIQLRCVATTIVLVQQPCTAMTLVIKLLDHLFEHLQMCKTRHIF